MIEQLKIKFALPYHRLVEEARFSYATFMRWKRRIAAGKAPIETPGPKKVVSFDITDLTKRIESLGHGNKRSRGACALCASFKDAVSRRELAAMIEAVRRRTNRQRQTSQCRVIWRRSNLIWAMDGSQYDAGLSDGKLHIANLQDLCSQYKFPPLSTVGHFCGEEMAGHLDRHFTRFGPPLFCKRDNGGNFNHLAVNQLLEEAMVIPINSPVMTAPYNGAIEHTQGEVKGYIDKWKPRAETSAELFLLADVAAHDLNHKPRRRLGGQTACQRYFGADRIRYPRRKRKAVYCWIRDLAVHLSEKAGKEVITNLAWRVAAKAWLVKNKLVTIVQPGNVSSYFHPIFCHN